MLRWGIQGEICLFEIQERKCRVDRQNWLGRAMEVALVEIFHAKLPCGQVELGELLEISRAFYLY